MTTYVIWAPEGTPSLTLRQMRDTAPRATVLEPAAGTFKTDRAALLAQAGAGVTVVIPSVVSLSRSTAADALAAVGQLVAAGCEVRSFAGERWLTAGPGTLAALGEWAAVAGGEIQRNRIRDGIAARRAAGLPVGGGKPGRRMPRTWSRKKGGSSGQAET